MRIIFKADTFKTVGREYAKVRLAIIVNNSLRKLYKLLEPILKAETPVRTGKLRASTRGQILYDGRNQMLSVRQGARTAGGAFYGRFVREGTPPHAIKPKEKGGVLAFMYKGELIFRKSVKHPGTKPNPYHMRTLARARPRIEALATEMGRDIVAIVNRGKR